MMLDAHFGENHRSVGRTQRRQDRDDVALGRRDAVSGAQVLGIDANEAPQFGKAGKAPGLAAKFVRVMRRPGGIMIEFNGCDGARRSALLRNRIGDIALLSGH